MISQSELNRHFDNIDGMLDVIAECERELDVMLSIEERPGPLPVIASDTAAPSVERFLQSMASPKDPGALARALAVRIRKSRKAKGWRQLDLADATGIARPNIARIESGRRMPKISTLQRIAKALELSLETMTDADE